MVRTSTGHALTLLALVAATAAIYLVLGGLLWAPFVYEDANWLPHLETMTFVPSLRPSRTITYATLAWTYDIAGLNPALYHLGNLAVHLVNGVLVYVVAAGLTSPAAALVAAGLFLLHPINSEAVSYVSSRTDLLSTTFVLLATWVVIGRHRWPWRAAGCVLALVAALWSKETGVVGIPLVLLTLYCWRRWATQHLAPAVVVLWISFGALVGASWSWIESVIRNMASPGAGHPYVDHLALQATVTGNLLWMVVWPVGLTVDHDVVGLGPWWAYGAALAATCAVAVGVSRARHDPMVIWGVGWVVLALAPRFIVRTGEFLNEHQMYLALVGVWIAVPVVAAGVIAHVQRWRATEEAAFFAALTGCAFLRRRTA